MDIAFRYKGWPKAQASAGGGRACLHPEWHALRARMIASHQAWRALDLQRSDEVSASCGSFDDRAARLIVDFEIGAFRVNPIDSANRNPGGDNLTVVAGTSRTGDRG